MDRNIYKPREFAKLLGVSVSTLARWDKSGWLKANKTPSNRPFYTDKHYDEFIEKTSVK
jgi:DNA-binding transcriptional MerR regulator